MREQEKSLIPLFVGILLTIPLLAAGEAHSLVIQTVEEGTGSPVEYPQVVLKVSAARSIGNEEGIAQLDMKTGVITDSLKVSCIGYFPKEIILDKVSIDDTVVVRLKKRIYSYPDVTVIPPRKVRSLTVGKRHSSGMMGAFADTMSGKGGSYAWEVGKKDRRTYLTGWGFHIIPDTITDVVKDVTTITYPLTKFRFRINIYDASEATDLRPAVRTNYHSAHVAPIVVSYNIEMVRDNRFLWTFPEPILLPEKALVEIEQLDDYPANERIYFRSNIFGKTFLTRLSNEYEDCWLKTNFAVPFFLNLREESF